MRISRFRDAPYRNNEDGSSQQGITVFLAESRERTSKAGMSHGSLIEYVGQKIKKTVLSTTEAELYSFHEMFWFMPVSRIWLSCECSYERTGSKERGNNSKNNSLT